MPTELRKRVLLTVLLFSSGVYYAPALHSTSSSFLNKEARQLHPSSHRTPYVISEIMYNPNGDDDTNSLEFIEIFNSEPLDKLIGGYRISGDIDYTFPTGQVIAARSFLIIARDPTAFIAEYGTGNVLGPYTGALPNDNGTVRLRNRSDALLLEVDYDSQLPWPIEADGAGHSIVLTRPDYGENSAEAWDASHAIGGSPEVDDPPTNTPFDGVVINEFLAHTDFPQTDFIELYNYDDAAVDISGCFLSDTTITNKFRIPTTTILPAGGHIAFFQSALGFSLSSHGDEIYFVSPDQSRVIDAVRFPAQQNGVSSGRFPDGAADLYTLTWPTTNAANILSGPRTEDIVINEIMYHPISGDDADEYVELYNHGSNAVDVGNWRFVDGINFTIPPGTTIPAGGYLVIARDAENLIGRYAQLNSGNTLGNTSGRLSDQCERIALARPDDPGFPFEDFVIVDEVTYSDGDDWGTWTDGDGSSLELIDPRSDNRRGMNWAGSDETEKAAWTDVDHLSTVDQGSEPYNQLHAMYLSRGECLIDDIVFESENGATVYLSENFEFGISTWTLLGNHFRSVLSVDRGVGGSQALHLRASGAGNMGEDVWSGTAEAFSNHARRALPGAPPPGAVARIRAKVRWQAGWPHMALILKGFWMEASIAMDIPQNLGTPGMQNSQHAANTGPAISEVRHDPVLPAAGENVRVTARVHDADGVASVTLNYRIDPSAANNALAMLDDGTAGDRIAGDGIFSAIIPGQSLNTTVAFTLEADDSAALPGTTEFPWEPAPGAPELECLVSFGQAVKSGIFANYIMWITQANLARWTSTPGGYHSNEPQHMTFVYGSYRAIYNAGARFRGQSRLYNSPINSGSYAVNLPKSDRFMGQNEIKIDQPGEDRTLMNELFCYWMNRQIDVPGAQIRFVQLHVNNNFRGTVHDLQAPTTDFTESWFNDSAPVVYKEVALQPPDPFNIYQDGFGKLKKSRYRMYWRKRRGAQPNDDFTPIFTVAQILDNFPFTETARKRIEALVDIRGWASFFTLSAAVHAWDHYGFYHAHNMYAYSPYHKPAWLFFYDADTVLIGNTGILPHTDFPIPDRMFNSYDPFKRVCYAVAKELLNGPFQPAASGAFMDDWYNALLVNNGAANNGLTLLPPDEKKTWVNSSHATLQGLVNGVDSAFAIASNNFATADHIVTLSGITPVEVSRVAINGIKNEVRFSGINSWELDVGLPEGTNLLTVTGHDWRGAVVTSDTITVTITAPPPSPIDQLVITEIMYHPIEKAAEFVEIYNASADRFDLRGWRLDGADIVFNGGSIIAPGEYRIVAENRTAYQHTHGNVELALGDYDGNLDNGGETIRLEMPVSSNIWVMIDEVHYDDEPPWPGEADGGGKSLQLIDITADNDRAGNWDVYSPNTNGVWIYQVVTGEVMNLSPIALGNAKFQVYAHSPGDVLVDDIVLVTGSVPESGPNLLENGDFEMTLSGPWSASGNHAASVIETNEAHAGTACLRVSATAAGNPPSDTVSQGESLIGLSGQMLTLSYWYKQTHSVSGLTVEMSLSYASSNHPVAPPPVTTEDNDTPGAASAVTGSLFTFPLLWINEVMPSNTMTIVDNHGDYDPWIELYNADSNAIDLTFYRLSDDGLDPGLWAFPTGTTIAVGERLMIWGDAETNETDAGNLHAAFMLNSASGIVVLAREHLGEAVVVDYVSYGQVGADASYGAYPEGERRSHQIFPTPTPGTANSQAAAPVSIVINEWMPDNDTILPDPSDGNFDDWFELYNASLVSVDLGGYFLTDDLTQTNKFAVPGNSIIPGQGFLLVWADQDTEVNGPGVDLHVNFRLSNAGEEIGLYAPDGTLIDGVLFGPLTDNQSQGSWPDGASVIYPMLPPTPATTNSVYVSFSIDVSGMSNDIYRLEANDDLLGTNWFLIDIITADTDVVIFSDPDAIAFPNRFYRITEQP